MANESAVVFSKTQDRSSDNMLRPISSTLGPALLKLLALGDQTEWDSGNDREAEANIHDTRKPLV